MNYSSIVWQNDKWFTLTSGDAFYFFNTDLKEMRNVLKGYITAMDWDRSGDFLAYVSAQMRLQCDIKVWQSSKRKFCCGWENNQQNDEIINVKWLKSANAPDGENGIALASVGPGELKLWKKDGTCAVIHKTGKNFRGFSPSGSFFVVGKEIRTTLTNDFVKKHGGTISVESEFGVGSTFTFSLPNTSFNF